MKMMDNDMHDVEPVHIFLQDSGGTVKSYLTKVIYNVTSKALLYLCKDHDKPQVTHSRKKKKKKKKKQMSLLSKIKQYVNGMIKHTEVNKMHTQHKWKQWNSTTLIIMPK